MPFDPTKPAPSDVLDAVLIRAQLVALKTLIDTQAAQLAGLVAQVAALQAQLASDLAGTANNIPGITTLGLSISSPRNNPKSSPSPTKWTNSSITCDGCEPMPRKNLSVPDSSSNEGRNPQAEPQPPAHSQPAPGV